MTLAKDKKIQSVAALSSEDVKRGRRVSQTRHCPECGSAQIVEDLDQGEVVCRACGLVLSQYIISRKPEWNVYTEEDKKRGGRVGPPMLPGSGGRDLSTVIDFNARNGAGRTLSSSEQQEAKKLGRWQRRIQNTISTDRNLAQAMLELDKITSILHIPVPIKQQATLTYRRALKKNIVRRRSISDVIVACLYVACRSSGTPRSLREVCHVAGVKSKAVSRVYRLLLREFEMKMPIDDPKRFISGIASRIHASPRVEKRSLVLLEQVRKKNLVRGRSPRGIAGTMLYIASILEKEGNLTQQEVARAADVTEVTVRNRYRELMLAMFGDVPNRRIARTPNKKGDSALNPVQGGGARVPNSEPLQLPLASSSPIKN